MQNRTYIRMTTNWIIYIEITANENKNVFVKTQINNNYETKLQPISCTII